MRLSDLIDTPFVWAGHNPGFGLDCYGLAIEARRIILPESNPFPDYDYVYKIHDRDSFPPTLMAKLFLECDRTRRISSSVGCEAGDIVLTLGTRGGAICTAIDAEQVIGFGNDERVQIIPIPALRVLSYWRMV
jgi:cell wall-associated NlpC family hydrolase